MNGHVPVLKLKNVMCLCLSPGSSISLKELELFVEDWALSLERDNLMFLEPLHLKRNFCYMPHYITKF
jgi:hypothetical protein